MNTFMQYLNFAGVLALTGLCLVQWRANRSVNLEANALEKTRLEQAAIIEEQGKRVEGLEADLETFREHLASTSRGWNEAKSNLARVEFEARQLTNEREQLKVSVTNWANAVAARDTQLKEVAEQLKTLAAERNETVVKFNELAENYNAVVRDLNERTQQFNELAQRFNKDAKKE
jgi:chromosome segregation ATPase